jgi:thioredoxin reductase (NADPH)
MTNYLVLLYVIPVAAILGWYVRSRHRREAQSLRAAQEAIEASMTEPPSLHPVIDSTRCIGCRSCVNACPEQQSHAVLGMIRGKARLIGPTNCIGHGACKAACPVDAIDLVFGTERRGVDIPTVKPDFETNVPGIFIAGELGGMGLIRNAVEQGCQAMASIAKLDGLGVEGMLDVVIVGAGPAGIAASLAAMDARLDFITLEQDSLGGTVAHFPRGKLVMTRPAVLPIVGKMNFVETSKERLIEYWQKIERDTGLGIRYNERVTAIGARGGRPPSFEIQTSRGRYRARAVLLTIGRRGTPRQLGVPGEDQPKVVYRLIDAEQYRDQAVLVVGGGDSALEAACSIAEQPGTDVTLSYRSAAFSRAKAKNRDRVEQLCSERRLRVLMQSNVREIREDTVAIDVDGETLILPNQAVIVCAGGILPTAFLKEVGIEVETKYGTA